MTFMQASYKGTHMESTDLKLSLIRRHGTELGNEGVLRYLLGDRQV